LDTNEANDRNRIVNKRKKIMRMHRASDTGRGSPEVEAKEVSHDPWGREKLNKRELPGLLSKLDGGGNWVERRKNDREKERIRSINLKSFSEGRY